MRLVVRVSVGIHAFVATSLKKEMTRARARGCWGFAELTDAGARRRAGADQGRLRNALAVLAAVLVESCLHVLGVVAADGRQVVGGVLLADDREQAGWGVG